MMLPFSWISLLYDLLYLLPLSLTAASFARLLPVFPEEMPGLYAAVFLIIALFLAYKYLRLKGRLIFTAVLLELLLILVLIRPKETRWEFLQSQLHFAVLAGILFLVFLYVTFMHRFRILKYLLGLGAAAGLVLMLIFYFEITRLNVSLILFVFLLVSAETIQHFWKKSGDTDPKKHLVFLSPFLLAVFLVTAVLKSPEDPYDWHLFRKIYADAATFFDRVSISLFEGFGDSYESSVMGFSESGSLPGFMSRDPKEVMDLTTDSSRLPTIYLAGKTFDVFDGHDWQQNYNSSLNDRFFDIIKILAAIRTVDPGFTRDYLRSERLNVTYSHFKSRYIFTPLKTFITESSFTDVPFAFYGGSIRSDTLLTYKYPYHYTFYRVNRDTELFKTLVSSEIEMTPSLLLTTLKEYAYDFGDFPSDTFYAWESEIHQAYTERIGLTQRTQDWLDDVTKDASSDYEKLLLLEAELNTWDYNLEPGPIPDIVTDAASFLDYFLFENPTGFCSYYASVFVLLARSLGLPARYVQGYLADFNGQKNLTLYSSSAHSWPEVYFDSVGWISFEPTPTFKTDPGWEVTDRNPKPVDPYNDIPDVPDDPGEPDIIPEEPVEPEPEPEKFRLIYVLLPLILLVVSALIILLFEYLKIRKRYETASPPEKAVIMFQRNMKLLEGLDLKRRFSETLEEFSGRALKYLPDLDLSFFGIYEELIYSPHKADMQAADVMEEANVMLKARLKKEKPWLWCFYSLKSLL